MTVHEKYILGMLRNHFGLSLAEARLIMEAWRKGQAKGFYLCTPYSDHLLMSAINVWLCEIYSGGRESSQASVL